MAKWLKHCHTVVLVAKEIYLKCAQNNMSRDNHWKSVKASIAQIIVKFLQYFTIIT